MIENNQPNSNEFLTSEPSNWALTGEDPNLITADRITLRKDIATQLSGLPDDFYDLFKHAQIETGCGNVCQMCSQGASGSATSLTRNGFYDLFSGLRAVAWQKFGKDAHPLINKMKKGVITPFLDNDSMSSNELLEEQLAVFGRDFGAKLALSTVGFSRKNSELATMHRRIGNSTELLRYIHRLRFSWTKYPFGASATDPTEYLEDAINGLDTYRRLYEEPEFHDRSTLHYELHYKPFVELTDVEDRVINGYHVIKAGPHIYMSRKPGLEPEVIDITRSLSKQDIQLSGSVHAYVSLVSNRFRTMSIDEIGIEQLSQLVASEKPPEGMVRSDVQLSKWENQGGPYYSVDPFHDQTALTFNAVHVYPKTNKREVAGYNNATRIIPNLWVRHKQDYFGIGRKGTPDHCSWEEVAAFIARADAEIQTLATVDSLFAEHVITEQLELYKRLIIVLRGANFPPKAFFDGGFIKDTGQLINQGKGIHLFQGLATTEDDPMTPNDRRNNVRVLNLADKKVWRGAPIPPTKVSNRVRTGFKNQGHHDEATASGLPFIGRYLIQKLRPHDLYPDPEAIQFTTIVEGVELITHDARSMQDVYLIPGLP
ncbi:MAG: hypothetical protein WCO06_07205 [Candidatus Roizmanbacteria bacterium]